MAQLRHQYRLAFLLPVAPGIIAAVASPARAVGWDNDDFIITGAPNFPDRIGIFDQNFAFKGFLFTNWVGVQGLNFDGQGRLVVFNSLSPEVRLYEPSGAQVGGFTTATSPMLTTGGDVNVMPNGNYIIGTSANGARVFSPQGEFIRQYGDGNSSSIALLPGQQLWSGNPGTLTMKVFDSDTGLEVRSFLLDHQTRPSYMNYSSTTNSVLCIDRDRDAGGVFERDLDGILLRQFHIPLAQTTCNGATRGPAGEVFGTSSNFNLDVVEWQSDANVVRTYDVYPVEITAARILWAGVVPEPGGAVLSVAGVFALHLLRPARTRRQVSG